MTTKTVKHCTLSTWALTSARCCVNARKRCITNFNFLLWLILDSHVTGTGNSLVQNRPSIPTRRTANYRLISVFQQPSTPTQRRPMCTATYRFSAFNKIVNVVCAIVMFISCEWFICNCEANLMCHEVEFQCHNTGRCIRESHYFCNGHDDCGDRSDEPANCSEWQFC